MSGLQDTNALVSSLLRDLAAVQSNRQAGFGYKRAADAMLDLPRPIETFVESDGSLRKILHVGPKSEQVILEVLRTGGSPTVEQAVRSSENAGDDEFQLGRH